MPQDFYQIAQEHHRSGRFALAMQNYRTALAENPNHADAVHFFGVLIMQAGRPDQAIGPLQRAVQLRPDDPAVHFNLGQAFLQNRQFNLAITALEKSRQLLPTRPETNVALAQALLKRKSTGDIDKAVDAAHAALYDGHESMGARQTLISALLLAGRYAHAISACNAALTKYPDHPQLLYHLGLALKSVGQLVPAKKAITQSLEIDSGNAKSWCALAAIDSAMGNHDIAIGLYNRALKIDPNCAPAHQGIARTLQEQGNSAGAMQAYARAMQASRPQSPPTPLLLNDAIARKDQSLGGAMTTEFHHALAAMVDLFPPAQIPTQRIAALFDKYADDFDAHLLGKLEYRVPELIVSTLSHFLPDRPSAILDAGCGTGLCATALRPLTDRLCGLDLSPAMIEKARARNLYDHLAVGEIVHILNQVENEFDAIVFADVLIYMGDLSPVMQAIAHSLKATGIAAFTLETFAGDRFHLHKKTLRYTHSPAYIEKVATMHGFEILSMENHILRTESEKPVQGILTVLRWPG